MSGGVLFGHNDVFLPLFLLFSIEAFVCLPCQQSAQTRMVRVGWVPGQTLIGDYGKLFNRAVFYTVR